MKSGHIASNYSSCYLCRKCDGGKHHISLCVGKPSEKEALPKPLDVFSTHVGVTNGILLQIAISLVSCSLGASCLTTLILSDSGCQRSYINQSVREKLGLENVRMASLILRTFGHLEGIVKCFDVVKIWVKYRTEEKPLYFEVLCVPFICIPLSNQKLSVTCEKFLFLRICS